MTAFGAPVALIHMARSRLDSIDLLRGIVMVLMALDHVRAYVAPQFVDGDFATPEMIPGIEPAWFATRWVTHVCAPVFVLLAGTSVFLFRSRGRSRGEVARFLLTRGLWLIALELTVVHFGWFATDPYRVILFQVIWAIGASMVAMSVLILLPTGVVGGIGLTIVGLHGLLPASPEAQHALMFLSSSGSFPVGGRLVVVNYPVLPWLGVMACGYALGPVMLEDAPRRCRRLLALGTCLTVGFVVLRFADVYGEPAAWRTMTDRAGGVGEDGGRSIVDAAIAFLNCTKYPPSLLFLLMTLGPALIALALFDRVRLDRPVTRFFIVFGRVPLFYYVLHLFAIQVVVAMWALARFGWDATSWGIENPPPPAYTQYGLWPVFGAWIVVVVALYPACGWFARLKQRRAEWWVSYL